MELRGQIPSELGNLTNLTGLNLGHNQLTGQIPFHLGNLGNLTGLFLSNNKLTGQIPSQLGGLKNLTALWLSDNELIGQIPSTFNQLTSLRRLSLCPGNHFVGPIPTFPHSPNLDLASIDFSCITGARLQGQVTAGPLSRSATCDDGFDPLDQARVFYDGTYLGTASGGAFELSIHEGTFDITAEPLYPDLYYPHCPDTGYYRVQVNSLADTIVGLDFTVGERQSCPLMQVSLEAGRQRWCDENRINLHYRNVGTQPADSAWIELTLPHFITITASDPPYKEESPGKYLFPLGQVDEGASGTINLADLVSCDVRLGTTICADVRIYPQYQCADAYPAPEMSLDLQAACEGDSIRFAILNNGGEEVSTHYVLVEDFTVIDSVPIVLSPAAWHEVRFPSTGHTYVMLVDDGDDDPNNNPWTGIEQCGGGPFVSGILGQYPTQGDLHQNRLCRLLRGSYDPNDKLADPPGAGPDRYLLPNTPIKYTVRFQNTGNDTAFAVVILDTIDTTTLDILTLIPGPSSHPYRFQVKEGRILEFTFHPISLPDSLTDLEGSQGYVTYTIHQQPDLPLGSKIQNRAAIYFDNNPPVITNTYVHTLHRPERRQSTATKEVLPPQLIISPNPSQGAVTLQSDQRIHHVDVFDLMGRHRGRHDGSRLHISDDGVYLLKVDFGEGKPPATVKVVIQ